jgi:hypothetical protein
MVDFAVQKSRVFTGTVAALGLLPLVFVVVAASSSTSPAGEYFEVVSKLDPSRKGKIPKTVFNGPPDGFYVKTSHKVNKIRVATSACSSVGLDGSSPSEDAAAAANALIGNAFVTVVSGSAFIKTWPGYALITQWAGGHAFSSLFPDGNLSDSDSNLYNCSWRLELILCCLQVHLC